jgi:hypothetical protein
MCSDVVERMLTRGVTLPVDETVAQAAYASASLFSVGVGDPAVQALVEPACVVTARVPAVVYPSEPPNAKIRSPDAAALRAGVSL